jgi:hypothetical protein
MSRLYVESSYVPAFTIAGVISGSGAPAFMGISSAITDLVTPNTLV